MRYECHPGQKLGRWTLGELLGRGAFGETWTATDASGVQGAVKLLPGPPGEELLALARVCHPSVPMLLDAHGSPPMLVMSLAQGRPLSAMLRHGAAPESAALTISALLADALAAVHQADVVHGDIKPANVLVGSVARREVSLVDFGMVGTQGGTLQYAAPERLSAGAATTASDVYTLGLLLWEMLHGQLPWMEQGISASLSRRKRGAPVSTTTSGWVSELLTRMLAPDPARRPSAAWVADSLVANGVTLSQVSADTLRARASQIYVPLPTVGALRDRWLQQGGQVAIIGPPGSGRTAAMRQFIVQLQASGQPWVRFNTGESQWSAVENALRSPVLTHGPAPLPMVLNAEERAERTAALLEKQGTSELAVLVDDWERLDKGSLRVLDALARRGVVRLCVTGVTAPSWASETALLPPLDASELERLISQLLGAAAPAALLSEKVLAASGGWVKSAVGFIITACDQSILQQRAGRWVADEELLTGLADAGGWSSDPPPPADPNAATLGGLIALARVPVARRQLSAYADLPEDEVAAALGLLLRSGLVKQEQGQVSVGSSAAARTLKAACPDPKRISEQLLLHSTNDNPQAGWYALGADATERLREDGPAMIRQVLLRSPSEAARMSAEIWQRLPEPHIALAHITAMRKDSQLNEAMDFAEEQTEAHPDVAGLWVALARLRSRSETAPAEIFAALERARALPDFAGLELEATICEVHAHNRLHQPLEAIRAARSALETHPPGSPEAVDSWLHLTLLCSQCMGGIGQLHEAIDMCAALPSSLGRGLPSRAMVEAAHGRLLWMAGDPRSAAERMDLALQLGEQLPAIDRARLLNNVGLVRYSIGERLEALRRWEGCLPLMERLEQRDDQVRVHNNLCVGYREVGRWERARQAGLWAFEHAPSSRVPDVGALAAGNLGDLALEQGDIPTALSWYSKATVLAEKHGVQEELAELDRRRAAVAVQTNARGARELAEQAAKSADFVRDSDNLCRSRAMLALCHSRDGDHDAAEALLHETMQKLREAGSAGVLAEVRLYAAEAYFLAGWHSRALLACERARNYAEELQLLPLRDRADRQAQRIQQVQSGAGIGQQQLATLVSLTSALVHEPDDNRRLQRCADSACAISGAERAFLILCRDGGEQIVARSGNERGELPSSSIIHRVCTTGKEVIADDLLERGDLRAAESVLNLALRSVMCLPLRTDSEILGAIYVDSRHNSDLLSTTGAQLLRGLATFMALSISQSIDRAQLTEQAHRAAEVVHDLRAPIATMITLADEVVNRGAEREAGDNIRLLGHRALRLAENLLNDKGPARHAFEASDAIAEVCSSMAPSARALSRQIRCEVEAGHRLTGDPDDLRRVVTNLLTNALRYGEGDIDVTFEEHHGALQLSVRDHGPGLPSDIENRVFERGAKTGGAGSHGLGAAIVLRIVTMMGGALEAVNHPDGGACFIVTFPIEHSRHPDERAAG